MLFLSVFLFIRGSNTVDAANLLHTFSVTCAVFLKKTCNFVDMCVDMHIYLSIRLFN